jgi:hypothetical protein
MTTDNDLPTGLNPFDDRALHLSLLPGVTHVARDASKIHEL